MDPSLKETIAKMDRFGPATTDLKTFTNPLLKVNWTLGNTCTYACSYCCFSSHDGSNKWPNVERAVKAVQALNRIYKAEPYNKQKIVFEVLGGELTLWSDLEPVLDAIKTTDNLCMLVSNGVRTVDWWARNAKLFGYVTLSYHPEYADYRHITKVSNILCEAGVGVGILCLWYPPKWETLVEAREYFIAHSQASFITVQPLTLHSYSKAGAELSAGSAENSNWPYSEAQQAFLRETKTIIRKAKIEDARWLMVSVKYSHSAHPDQPMVVEPSMLSSHGFNNWKGWDCYVGIDTLHFEQNGDVRRDTMCRVAKPFGNWKTDNLESLAWPTQPIRCPFSACSCAHDFRARKEKPALEKDSATVSALQVVSP